MCSSSLYGRYHRFVSFNVLVLEEGVWQLDGLVLWVVVVEAVWEDKMTELGERKEEDGNVPGSSLVE